jgi:hypothetical protein
MKTQKPKRKSKKFFPAGPKSRPACAVVTCGGATE